MINNRRNVENSARRPLLRKYTGVKDVEDGRRRSMSAYVTADGCNYISVRSHRRRRSFCRTSACYYDAKHGSSAAGAAARNDVRRETATASSEYEDRAQGESGRDNVDSRTFSQVLRGGVSVTPVFGYFRLRRRNLTRRPRLCTK